jgi:hypothetical protein
MSVLIFSLLGSIAPEAPRTRQDELKNGLFSTIAFVLGALTSCLSGYLGMKIATYANARTALEARRGIAPAFMCGEHPGPSLPAARAHAAARPRAVNTHTSGCAMRGGAHNACSGRARGRACLD